MHTRDNLAPLRRGGRTGERSSCKSANGSRSRQPIPKRNAPRVSGSVALMTKRVTPTARPASTVLLAAAQTPHNSPISQTAILHIEGGCDHTVVKRMEQPVALHAK